MVPFENRFRGTSSEIARQVLDARLARGVELSGALNRALPALRRIRRERRFTESHAARRLGERFQQATDPCALWLDAETIASPTALVTQDGLYRAYTAACLALNQPVITRQMFGRRLRQLRPELEEGQRVIEGRKQWVYLGITLRAGKAVHHTIHSL